MAIHVGTSGYSYQDWRGHFYPENLPQREMLTFYARHFDTVEINSTYYRMPDPGMFSRMLQKVPPEFRFVVKASKELTHEITGNVEAHFAQFVHALSPLCERGQLGCVLAQFPWSFHNTPSNRAYLCALTKHMPNIPIVVEFRNREWVQEETFALMRTAGLGYCCVDEPSLKGLMPPLALATSAIGYFRFHGRNAEKWWQHQAAWERYDYLYSESELAEWVPRIRHVAEQTQETYVFFNNHYQGKAGYNAKMLVDLLLAAPERAY